MTSQNEPKPEAAAPKLGEEDLEGGLSGPSLSRTTTIALPPDLIEPPASSETPTRRERIPRELEVAPTHPYREPKAVRVQREGVPDLIVPLY
ncbi:MAG TPA: hypothetical protein VEY88_25475, partial [Archangium sp.]|nr:hypothetical protein [Archangium sp.]